MRRHEVHEGGALAGRALAAVAGAIRGSHLATSVRVFNRLGAPAAPVRRAHDAISSLVYGSVALGLREVPRGAAAAAALTRTPEHPALGQSVGGAMVLGALNGAAGDLLAAHRSPLAVDMEVRAGGYRVEVSAAALRRTYPQATGRIAVFLHGLAANEDVWRLDPWGRDAPGRLVYGDLLAAEHAITPVYVRYNTGRRISDNGRDLSVLLEGLVSGWPVPVHSIALVGHSMGGLVSRAACHVAERDEHAWLGRTHHVVCLGSPHDGAPLERGANVLSHLLRAVPETRPWGGLVNVRSVGIKDLRYGSVAETDWDGHDPDELLRDRRGVVEPPEGVTVHVVSACVTADRAHPIGRVVGDVLVQERSAAGPRRLRPLVAHAEHAHHVDGANHWTLLSHPDVGDALCRWLAEVPEVVAPGG